MTTGGEHGFDRPASYAGLFRHFSQYYERLFDLTIDAGGIEPSVVLDLGCGTGDFTGLIARRFPKTRVVGLDVSPAYVNYARSRPELRGIEFHVSPAQSLPGLRWVGDVDMIFIKGAYHLFEHALPIDMFAHPAFRSLRWVVIVEKTERSLGSYPVPLSAAEKRKAYVSAELGTRRIRAPAGATFKSLSYGEAIAVPVADYLQAVSDRQFSYLDATSDEELGAWLHEQERDDTISLFEENVSNIYQL